MKDDVGPRGAQCSFQSVKYTRRYAFLSERSRGGAGGMERRNNSLFSLLMTHDSCGRGGKGEGETEAGGGNRGVFQ